MNFSLTRIRNQLVQSRTLLLGLVGISFAVFLIIIVVIINQQKTKQLAPVPSVTPPPIRQQPVVNGRFDQTAPQSQRSREAIEKLKPYLLYRETITTSTGTPVTFAVMTQPLVHHTLYVGMVNINFQSTYDDPNLPKHVQNFREAANAIFVFMQSHGVNPSDVFISWGGPPDYIQKSAEVWLAPSEKFPEVVKKGDRFVFKIDPVR